MKQKRQVVMLSGLVALVAVVFYFDVKGPLPAQVRPATEPLPPLPVENPSLRRDKLRASSETEYQSSGRDLFSDVVEPAPRPKPARHTEPLPLPPPPPAPPPPPQLPVKFYGYGSVPTKRAFLTDGDDIYIVGEGDTLLGRFRILKINNTNLEFEEISSGRRGTAPLEEQAAPPA